MFVYFDHSSESSNKLEIIEPSKPREKCLQEIAFKILRAKLNETILMQWEKKEYFLKNK